MGFSDFLIIDDSDIFVNLFKSLPGNEPKWVSTKDKDIDEILNDIAGKAKDIQRYHVKEIKPQKKEAK